MTGHRHVKITGISTLQESGQNSIDVNSMHSTGEEGQRENEI